MPLVYSRLRRGEAFVRWLQQTTRVVMFTRRRRAEVSQMRRIAAVALRDHGFTYEGIGTLLQMGTHTNVMWHIERASAEERAYAASFWFMFSEGWSEEKAAEKIQHVTVGLPGIA